MRCEATAMSDKKRLERLEQECRQHKKKQKLNNKRIVYLKKKLAHKLEKRFRQYPKQKFSDIVEKCLERCLDNKPETQTSRTINIDTRPISDRK
jgi:biotin-(acetyl-CoA carboxylase) ligase